MKPVLLRGGHVYSAQAPFATAALIFEGRFAWLGDDAAAMAYADDATIVDLQGALVTPAFVDAHVHTTATGLALTGLDLTGVTSASECLDALSAYARAHPGQVVLGHGWDETTWVDSTIPTCAEIDRASDGALVYLTRVDVHSALASSALRSLCPELPGLIGFDAEGPLSRQAHDAARQQALASVSNAQRDLAQSAALDQATRMGIASVHEMAGPIISDADDLRAVLDLGRQPHRPEVIGYWGELGAHVRADAIGAHGAAGDLSIDGAIGSRTACLRTPYDDDGDTCGAQYIDLDEATAHLDAATAAGRQAGFHVIGDGAADVAVAALEAVERSRGAEAVRRAHHRLEHVEMLDEHHRATLARLGVIASMQPAFDAAWGGPDRMYARRLGADRASTLNDFASAAASGVVLAFGSDAPVTPLDPWGAVAAAVHHRNPDHAITARAAFTAHTRGGRRAAAADMDEPGVIAVDAPATYAVWSPGPLNVQTPDGRVAAWSTDPASGTPPLPDLSEAVPTCWRTVRRGVTIFDAGALA